MRRKITLFAGLFLALSLNVKAADIIVDPTLTTLPAAYASAASGDVLVLMDGNYVVDGNITMTKAITIKAQNSKKATISGASFLFTTSSTGSLTVQDLVLDGTKTGGTTFAGYLVDFNGTYPLAVNQITFDNCSITKYGNCMLRANRGECTCDGLKINNCIIYNNGYVAAYPFFQVTKTKFGTGSLELTNSTVYDFANEYIQNYSTTAGGDNTATYLFKNNTFFNTVTVTARRPFNFSSGIVKVQNNIFVQSTTGTRLLSQTININAAIASTEFSYNDVYNYKSDSLLYYTGWQTNLFNHNDNPMFKDSANNDFTLPEGSTLITMKVGDPRWFGTISAINSPKASSTAISYNGTEIKLSETRDINIYSVTGELLKSAKQVNVLSVANLSKGIYIVKAGSAVQKFISR
ncbi:MAG TPA: DUF4957 domain-containing protein [Paludibacter sp.]|nr:DUF4957 domain-containing protein [Paludibacter sp.]